ncbi:MAG TPA: hypothetical protein VK171_11920 [Fimbriimonas sp.]|nr:hypothetical protein [Fimbriimonas sp.]
MSEVISNYPRGEDSPALTPELARAILNLASLFPIWMLAPQAIWFLLAVPRIRAMVVGQSNASLTYLLMVIAGLLFLVTLIGLWTYLRYLILSKRAAWPGILVWTLTFFPVLGLFGPVMIAGDLNRVVKLYGVIGPAGRFPREQLQALIESAELEKLMERHED